MDGHIDSSGIGMSAVMEIVNLTRYPIEIKFAVLGDDLIANRTQTVFNLPPPVLRHGKVQLSKPAHPQAIAVGATNDVMSTAICLEYVVRRRQHHFTSIAQRICPLRLLMFSVPNLQHIVLHHLVCLQMQCIHEFNPFIPLTLDTLLTDRYLVLEDRVKTQ